MTDAEIVAECMRYTGATREELVNTVMYDHMIMADGEKTYSVFVRVNAEGYLTDIDSDAFITDPSNWFKVDEGRGELYKYARVNYCPKGLVSDGFHNYRLVDGVVVYAPQIDPPEDHNELSPTEQFFVASRRYIPGELVSVQGRMYEVISIILPGGAINPGTNVREITLEQYINKKVEEATA